MVAPRPQLVVGLARYYLDVPLSVGANVPVPAHHPLTGVDASLMEVPAVLPNLEPLPVGKLPLDPPRSGAGSLDPKGVTERIGHSDRMPYSIPEGQPPGSLQYYRRSGSFRGGIFFEKNLPVPLAV